MKQNYPKKKDEKISGKVNIYDVPKGPMPRQTGAGIHQDKRKKREQDKLRKDLRNVDEVAPPGWESTVKGMKKHKEIDNPWALAWHMKKKGYKSRKKESTLGYPTFGEWLENNHTGFRKGIK